MPDDRLQILSDRALAAASDRIWHGFFTRKGGVSEGIYASLNVGFGSDDAQRHVEENRRRAGIRMAAAALNTVYQVHGTDVIRVTEPWAPEVAPKADAMVTDRPGIALGILSADCAPLLFCDPVARVVGAAHAGWRGALGGVGSATVEVMTELGARADRIVAAIGPAIGPRSYEVGAEFPAPFLEQDAGNATYFRDANRPDHFFFDLPGYIAASLEALGLAAVGWIGRDTCEEPENFFSYRRATLSGEPDYGRLLSAILIEA